MQTLDWEAYTGCARRAAADGIVLLRNEKGVLPLPEGTVVSLFGRGQLTYYKSGTGSGGMVNVSHVTGIREALDADPGIVLNRELMHLYDRWNDENPPETGNGWGDDPWSQAEMPLTGRIAENAALHSDAAVCILARTAGEDRDAEEAPGSWLLTQTEMQMLSLVRAHFEKMIVLLNVGSIIDMSFVEKIRPDAVLYVWQGGMVGGLGVSDVLSGRVCPGGHLTDTIAASLSDYPSSANFGKGDRDLYAEDIYIGYRYFESVAKGRVLYPFGFGLTYTSFSIECGRVAARGEEESGRMSVDFRATVTNTGARSGRQVVQVYARCPQGKLGKSVRVLVDFRKTRLLEPGESETLSFEVPVKRFASYDDSGVTKNPGCWVLEPGRYDLFVGDNVRDAVCITQESGAFELSGNRLIERAEEACAPVTPFRRMVMRSEDGAAPEACALRADYEDVPLRSVDNEKRVREELPCEFPYTAGDLKLTDVRAGRCTMEDFIAQLSDARLSDIVRGEGMGSPLVTPGTAAAFGGVTKKLRERGIPALCCADGPSGMRLDCGDHAFSLPNGTLLACTFDPALVEELFSFVGLEMVKNRVDCLLGPGINIHRHPLNGRNFEYFSEDPYVTGIMACAQIRGLHKHSVTGVLKHFAANNRETGRRSLDSAVSERALREIYLKGFEIAVREGGADAIMTSYGLLNGVHTSSLYDLTTTILRGEWGFDGIVMTDWWASFSPKELIDETLSGAAHFSKEESSRDCQAESALPGKPDEASLTQDLMSGLITDFSTMVRAQNDLFMVLADGEWTGSSLEQGREQEGRFVSEAQSRELGIARDPRFRGTTCDAVSQGRLTRGELQRCAMNICRFALKSEAMNRLVSEGTTVEVIHAPEGEKLDAVAEVSFQKIPEEGLTLDLTDLPCGRGDDSLLGFEMEPGARYTFSFEGSCTAGGLAQVPVSVFFTSIPLAVLVWSGTGGRTVTKSVRFLATMRSNVFRLHFGQTGVKLHCVHVAKDSSVQDRRRGIILDVDGTLWDAVAVITRSWNAALEKVTAVTGIITESQMRQCLGKTMFEIADMLFGYLPVERRREVLDEAMRYEVEYLWDHPGNVYPAVRKTLESLRADGWHLYIVSNCQKGYIEDFLHALGDEGLIEDHLCFEDTLKDKGSNIRLCMERNDLETAVYVGDTAGDLAAARAAGCGFVYAAYGFGDVDAQAEGVRQIGSFEELVSVMRS